MAGEIYKILIVDDDEFLLDIYSKKFTESGMEVTAVRGGKEALNKIQEDDTYDAVLLDVLMPTFSGLDLLQALRTEGLARDTALIVLSNQGQQSDIDKADEFDVAGYIIKASTVPTEVFKEVVDIIRSFKENK